MSVDTKKNYFGPRDDEDAEEYWTILLEAEELGDAEEWDKACEAQERAVKYAEEHYGDDLSAKSGLAYLYRQVSRHKDAEALDRYILSVRQQILGDDHEDTVASLNNLAIDLKAQGEYDQSLELDKKALEIMLRIKGEDSQTTQTSMHNLANSYFNNKDYQAALDLHQRALDLRTKTLGPDHFQTIMTMDLLGRDYGALDKLQEAVALQEKAVEAARTHLGPSNQTTIKCSLNLASTYGRLNQANAEETPGGTWESKGIKLLEGIVEMQRQGPGEEHSDTIAAMNNLSVAYFHAGRLEDAVPLMQKSVNWNMKKLGPNHPQTQAASGNLDYVCEKLGMTRASIF
ncbi:tetratricopeptide repeat protein [Trichophyton verrucosum HKI 0517]|uniref:Tetratricopeptide repeat protein n=1 Tax=Trichophyton verrucosum (strain HKI 0517) TaxID=663202 RepID=D4DH32_TRIVH|nr:tetratricopeptide repeat protein [Trichophyton verrucosum HKI 0517]EFE38843.1 tetratricopeptide repeat protein [Trichophyton verrucosum HKI 0517]